jgi:hypothetical protein
MLLVGFRTEGREDRLDCELSGSEEATRRRSSKQEVDGAEDDHDHHDELRHWDSGQ